jgi:tRNA(His) 5'-end guanylyltransferase
MKDVACGMLERHNEASMVYCHSDEVTVVFPPRNVHHDGCREPHIFNGRSQKIASLLASECGILFYKMFGIHMTDTKIADQDLPAFDGRVLSFAEDDVTAVHQYFFWRSSLDCPRNFISTVFRHHFGKYALHNVGMIRQWAMLLDTGVKEEDFPACYFHGSFVKKIVVTLTATAASESYERRKILVRTLHLQEKVEPDLFKEKLWSEALLANSTECGL